MALKWSKKRHSMAIYQRIGSLSLQNFRALSSLKLNPAKAWLGFVCLGFVLFTSPIGVFPDVLNAKSKFLGGLEIKL